MKLSNLLLSTLLLSSTAFAGDMNTTKQEGIKYIKMLGGALKSELQAYMKKDPSGLEALAFCTGSAERITREVNAKLPAYAKVRRTALKVRNDTLNMPDATDTKVMHEYVAAIKAKTFKPTDMKTVEEGNVVRVYKPLLTGGICLKCHGTNVSPKIADALTSAYPKDRATGFKKGDLRGVIVSEITKEMITP